MRARAGAGKFVKAMVATKANYFSRFITIMQDVRPIRGVHRPVKLLLSNGRHIGWLLVTPYDPWPEYVINGSRLFKYTRQDPESGHRTYIEVTAHVDVFGIYKTEEEPVIEFRAGEFKGSVVGTRCDRDKDKDGK